MRLFIAICLPSQVKQQLSAYANIIGSLAERANITREDNFHLTLAFLGDALPKDVARAALDKISAAPFKLYSDKPGCFRRGSGAIYWLGLKSSPELTALHAQLYLALNEEGFSGEDKPYTPHLTLAREVRGLSLAQLPESPRFIVPVEGISLMESAAINGVLTYTAVHKVIF